MQIQVAFASSYTPTWGISLWVSWNFLEDICQVYAGGYGQISGDTCFVPSSLHRCFLLVVYEVKFTPEAMEKFFQDISLWVFVQVS